MLRNSFTLTFQYAKIIAPQIKHFVFSASQAIHFIPGQFITLHFPQAGTLLRRSYSLANRDSGDIHTLELAASYIPNGIASERLFNMQAGDQIEAIGAFGRFTLREEPIHRYLLIATGTGITPYRAMLNQLAQYMQSNPQLRVILLFGVRHLEDVLYREEFIAFAKDHAQFELRIHYSRASELTLPYEYSGYVTESLKHSIEIDPLQDVAYLCGNPNMVDDSFKILTEKQLPRDRIRREPYISPKLPTNKR